MLLSYDILVTHTLKEFQSGKYSVNFRHLYLTQYSQTPPPPRFLSFSRIVPSLTGLLDSKEAGEPSPISQRALTGSLLHTPFSSNPVMLTFPCLSSTVSTPGSATGQCSAGPWKTSLCPLVRLSDQFEVMHRRPAVCGSLSTHEAQ